MANIYVLDTGQRGFGDPSSSGAIVVTCLIETAAVDGSFFGEHFAVNVEITPPSTAQWNTLFKAAVAAWALSQGHVVDRLVLADFQTAVL